MNHEISKNTPMNNIINPSVVRKMMKEQLSTRQENGMKGQVRSDAVDKITEISQKMVMKITDEAVKIAEENESLVFNHFKENSQSQRRLVILPQHFMKAIVSLGMGHRLDWNQLRRIAEDEVVDDESSKINEHLLIRSPSELVEEFMRKRALELEDEESLDVNDEDDGPNEFISPHFVE